MLIRIATDSVKQPAIKVTGMPGKHVAPGVIGTLNDLINAVSPWTVVLSSKTTQDKGLEYLAGTPNERMDD